MGASLLRGPGLNCPERPPGIYGVQGQSPEALAGFLNALDGPPQGGVLGEPMGEGGGKCEWAGEGPVAQPSGPGRIGQKKECSRASRLPAGGHLLAVESLA